VNARINTALKGIRFGSVVLTIHDSRIVQIERIEKSRFDDLYLETAREFSNIFKGGQGTSIATELQF